MSKALFSGTLSNGVKVELLEAESFIGKTEFAVKVAGEVSSVSSINIMRTGAISVKTTAKSLKITPPEGSPSGLGGDAPTLSDVAPEA